MDTWNEAKRRITLVERGLDLAEAELVFAGKHFTRATDQRDFGEERFVTAGFLRERFVVVVWTLRDRWTMDYLHEART